MLRMRNSEFKPNTALGMSLPFCPPTKRCPFTSGVYMVNEHHLVILDFLIRHNYLTPDNEPDYLEILTRLHGRFNFDKWGSLS